MKITLYHIAIAFLLFATGCSEEFMPAGKPEAPTPTVIDDDLARFSMKVRNGGISSPTLILIHDSKTTNEFLFVYYGSCAGVARVSP